LHIVEQVDKPRSVFLGGFSCIRVAQFDNIELTQLILGNISMFIVPIVDFDLYLHVGSCTVNVRFYVYYPFYLLSYKLFMKMRIILRALFIF